jgi:hypothetical protein
MADLGPWTIIVGSLLAVWAAVAVWFAVAAIRARRRP